jgi:hypothetical protein
MTDFPRPTSTVRRHAWTFLLAVTLFAGIAALAVPVHGQAQSQPRSESQAEPHGTGGPPPVLVIYQEVEKVGRGSAHEKLEASFAQTFAQVPGQSHYLALASMFGTPRKWFLEGHPDFADLEKSDTAFESMPAVHKAKLDQMFAREADNLQSMARVVALYRDDLSMNPSVNLAKMRYMRVTTYQVKPGHGADFAKAAKLVRAAHEKMTSPVKWAVFQVYAGAPSGTYYVFEPTDSFTKAGPDPAMEKAFEEAIGNDGRTQLSQLVSDGIASSEMTVFAFKPSMSHVPPQLAQADPFWAPAATATAAVGTTGKTPAVKRASNPEKKK